MASPAASDIVNAIFAGQKDLSDFVNTAMHDKALDAIGAKKVEYGKTVFSPTPESPEGEEEVETEPEATTEPQEETPDETDNGND
tara:strand:- start:2856 stop:3110 length:255 start_codon:yes stop_codon:yes gene_type:complete